MVKVAFLHPDLGIGGAERAMIDCALALQSQGKEVEFITAHHDITHCFQETCDGTVKVTVAGDWLPRRFCGRFYALFAYLRMIYAACYLVFFSGILPEVVVCDQISACIPILIWLGRSYRVIFYCHFPDMLLTKRETILKQIYRYPIDWLEEKTTGLAHCVLVNSKYTAGIFKKTFKTLANVNVQVVYPIPNYKIFDRPTTSVRSDFIPDADVTFLSINRYERKKNLELALHSFVKLKERYGGKHISQLVIAGGYDERVVENRMYFQELQLLAQHLKIDSLVTFVRSFSDIEKVFLLERASCLLYTPDCEHFGIVPIESMYMRCPVIAVNSGGPVETVVHGKTGFLAEQSPDEFSRLMLHFMNCESKLGKQARNHVEAHFSFSEFCKQLNEIVDSVLGGK